MTDTTPRERRNPISEAIERAKSAERASVTFDTADLPEPDESQIAAIRYFVDEAV